MPVLGRYAAFAVPAMLLAGTAMIPGSFDVLRAAPPSGITVSTEPTAGDADLPSVAPAPVMDVAPDALDGPADFGAATAKAATELDADLECMAKVVYHEAANQPRAGQRAVAQTIMNRIASGRFAATPCAVANQPGQYFQTSAYNPPRGNAAWATAVDVSREARAGTGDDMAQGAMFFQTAAHGTPRAFHNRQRVATIGGHAFYR